MSRQPTTASPFDRVRTRTGTTDHGRRKRPTVPTPVGRDAEGKRALFSSTGPDADVPSVGSVTIDCRRCGERTVMSPAAAVRTAIPSLVLSLGLGRGERESTVGLVRRGDGTFMRCPACGRGSWTRVTIRL